MFRVLKGKLRDYSALCQYADYNPLFMARLSLLAGVWLSKGVLGRYYLPLKYRLNRLLEKEFLFRTPFGKFSLPSPSFWFYLAPGYEREVKKVFEENIHHHSALRKKIFLDIGANMGLYSLQLALNGYDVFSFEPSPQMLRLLRRNAVVNNLHEKIRVMPFALSDKDSFSEFMFFPDSPGCSRFDLSNDASSAYFKGVAERINVQTKKLDDVLSSLSVPLSKIKLVKIDVEGSEHSLLKGAVKTFRKLRDVDIIIEIWSFNPQKNRTINLMKSMGYSFRYLGNDNYHFWK